MIKVLLMMLALLNIHITFSKDWPYKESPYQVLGIERKATDAEIKKAYKALARQKHPDRIESIIEAQIKKQYENVDLTIAKNKESYDNALKQSKELATEDFKKLQAAYELLINPIKRASYDSGYDLYVYGGFVSEEAFLHACATGNTDLIKQILKSYKGVGRKYEVENEDYTMKVKGILEAILHHKMAVFATLLPISNISDIVPKKDYYSYFKDYKNYIPDDWHIIHYAAAFGLPSMIEELISKKRPLLNQESSPRGLTPLMIAAAFYRGDNVDQLLKLGASTKEVLILIAKENASIPAFTEHQGKALIEKGSTSAPAFTRHQDTIEKIITLLIQKGANITEENKYGKSALSIAVDNNNVGLIELLGVDRRGPLGDTPLMKAAEEGNVNLVKKLLHYKADVNIQSRIIKRTTLMKAVGSSKKISEDIRKQIVELLIDAGANINLQDLHQRTALMGAVENNDLSIVQLLLASGADAAITDKHGKTIFDYKSSAEMQKILSIYKKEEVRKQEALKSHQNSLFELTSTLHSLVKISII